MQQTLERPGAHGRVDNNDSARPVWRAQAATGSTGLDETFRAPLPVKGALSTERDYGSVELLVRDARLTDIDRISGLM